MSTLFDNSDDGALARVRAKDRKSMLFLLLFLTAWTVFTSVGTFAEAFSRTGMNLVKVVTVAGLGVVLYLCIRRLYAYGVTVLPFLALKKREAITGIYAGLVLLVATISMGTSVPFVAGKAAQEADTKSIVAEFNDPVNDMLGTKIFAAQSFFNTISNQLKAYRMAEIERGLFSGTRQPGEGVHTDILDSLIEMSDRAQTVVIEMHGRAKPVAEAIEESQEAIRKVFANDRLAYPEKIKLITEHLQAIKAGAAEFVNLLPIDSLETAVALYAQDFDSVGITDEAAVKLERLLHPAAQSLRSDLLTLRETAMIDFPHLEVDNPYAVIIRQWEAVWILILVAIAPDVISLMLLLVIFISDKRDEDDEFPETPLSPAAMKQIEALLASQATKPNGLAGPATRLPSDLLDRFPSSDDRSNKPS